MKTKTTAALCAAAIKEELKKLFVGVKFSVKSDNFSGGNSVHIEWTNGPLDDDVRVIVRKYQYGSFNSMEDLYEYTNSREDIPQAKYIQTRRELSPEVEALKPAFIELYGQESHYGEAEQCFYRVCRKNSIPAGATPVAIVEIPNACGSIEDLYKFSFTHEAETVADVAPEFTKVEVIEGEINIIDYSAKAIAVIGDTKPIKDKLKELGGKFNFRLTCGAGWIFPKTKLSDLEALLTA